MRRVLAIELLAAAQGIDLLRPLRSSRRSRRSTPRCASGWRSGIDDREFSPDLAAADAFVADGIDRHFELLR